MSISIFLYASPLQLACFVLCAVFSACLTMFHSLYKGSTPDLLFLALSLYFFPYFRIHNFPYLVLDLSF
jgi:hypothetical protein